MVVQDKYKKLSRTPILPVIALAVFLIVQIAAGRIALALYILPLCLIGIYFGFTGLAISFAILVIAQGILVKLGTVNLFPLRQISLLVIVPLVTAWVTKLLAQEKSLERAQKHLLEGLRDGVIISGCDNKIRLINPAAREFLKMPQAKEEWENYLKAIGVLKKWNACLISSEPFKGELQIEDKIVNIFINPVFEKSHLMGVVTTIVDVTHERQLAQTREDFLALISHELRNPLTSINGFTEVLLAENLPGKTMSHIKVIKNNTDRMLRLIRDLLHLKQLETFSFPLHTQIADLSEIIRCVALDMEAKIVQAGVILQIDYPETAVLGKYDSDRLSQVFINLLENAIKHSPGGKKIHIIISIKHECALVEVRDQGPGIPRDEIEKIFEKYYTLKSGKGMVHRGAGLGLALCRNLIELHHGQIWATCENGEGMSFWVSLPYGVDDDHTDDAAT